MDEVRVFKRALSEVEVQTLDRTTRHSAITRVPPVGTSGTVSMGSAVAGSAAQNQSLVRTRRSAACEEFRSAGRIGRCGFARLQGVARTMKSLGYSFLSCALATLS